MLTGDFEEPPDALDVFGGECQFRGVKPFEVARSDRPAFGVKKFHWSLQSPWSRAATSRCLGPFRILRRKRTSALEEKELTAPKTTFGSMPFVLHSGYHTPAERFRMRRRYREQAQVMSAGVSARPRRDDHGFDSRL